MGPIIVQSDRSILLEVNHPDFVEARDFLCTFSELTKSPEHLHTYNISPVSLWNAASGGVKSSEIVENLERLSKYPVPDIVNRDISDFMGRYGKIKLLDYNKEFFKLTFEDHGYFIRALNTKKIKDLSADQIGPSEVLVPFLNRGDIKLNLIKIGYPVEDLTSFQGGDELEIDMLDGKANSGEDFSLRDYQNLSIDAFYGQNLPGSCAGVVVLPCGSGKTVVGIGCIAKIKMHTLILTTSTTAANQWANELKDKTSIDPENVGLYTGSKKEVKPVTVSTYQMLTHRKDKKSDFKHLSVLKDRPWGFVIFDEVHLLPAPVFRFSAEVQAKRRLGLTATFIREDHKETDVFSLIGPKKYDVPWKELEKKGWIASAVCSEVKVPFPKHLEMDYAISNSKEQFRLACENSNKLKVLKVLLEKYKDAQVLIIGHYLRQLEEIAAEFANGEIITGNTPQDEREVKYNQFRNHSIKHLVVSKVANFAIDLPDANILIQVSGTYGSRQEEAQRLGRILRPKPHNNEARFYTLTSMETCEEEFSHKRQLFLAEQGYSYNIYSVKEKKGGFELVE